MFELKFKTKTIKTYGKRGRRVISYAEKNSDFEQLATFERSRSIPNATPEIPPSSPDIHTIPGRPSDLQKPKTPVACNNIFNETNQDFGPQESLPATPTILQEQQSPSDVYPGDTSPMKTIDSTQTPVLTPGHKAFASPSEAQHPENQQNDESELPPKGAAPQPVLHANGLTSLKNKPLLNDVTAPTDY
ncbi:hypothetical protein K493DRAFT_305798, partial [Basidiobolus meristosporus CBS 931.73]